MESLESSRIFRIIPYIAADALWLLHAPSQTCLSSQLQEMAVRLVADTATQQKDCASIRAMKPKQNHSAMVLLMLMLNLVSLMRMIIHGG